MEKKIENLKKEEEEEEKIENKDDEDDWESIPENEKTEEEKDIFYRLNIEKASKVKLDFHKFKNYHSIKVKRLEEKEIESFHKLDEYIKEQYLPNISINNNNSSNPYVTILNNDYVLKEHPEIGTYLIYEMDDENEEANLIGKSHTWYEATIFKPKIINRKSGNQPKINNIKKISRPIIKKNKTLKINQNEKIGNLNVLNKKRRRKRKKRKYPKDSTVIEIKRIFEDKEKKEENQNKNNNINS